jgi:hypothetical protein
MDPTLAGDPEWAGRRWRNHHSDWLTGLDQMNAYFSISIYTGNRRVERAFRACHVIVLDDIGTAKVAARDVLRVLGAPSYRIETSSGNEQWGYVLATPALDPASVKVLLQALGAKGLTDRTVTDVTRYMRLPISTNTKGGGAHRAVLREWHPERRFELEELLRQVGVGSASSSVPGQVPGTAGTGKWVSQKILAGGDPIIQKLSEWGELTGSRTGDGGWHLRACPWDSSHTPGAKVDDRSAVWAGGTFKCWHGHCVDKHRGEFLVWFGKRLDEESGGLFCDAAQLDMAPIDPSTSAMLAPVSPPATSAAPIAVSAIGVSSPDAAAAARAFMAEMIWVREQNRFFSRRTHGLIMREALDAAYVMPLRDLLTVPGPGKQTREIKPTDWWLRQSRRIEVDNLTYWPGGDPVVVLAGGLRHANRWRPSTLGQDVGLDIPNHLVRPWLDLVWHVVGNEGSRFFVHVLDWLALIVADPGRKPGWHLIVQGAQGIGKDLLMLPVVFAVGAGNVGMVSAAGLHRDHNPWAEKRLILVSELKQTSTGSASGRDQYNTLKALTENTSTTVPINEKNVKLYHARNVGAYYVTSNEHDALALDADDRRFVVAASTAVKRSRAYYTKLVAWLGGETGAGTEMVAAWLRQRYASLSAARRDVLMGNAFSTQSKIAMVDAADPVRAWTREQIEDGVWPDLMAGPDIDERYRLAARSKVLRYPVSSHRWGQLVRDLGGAKVYGGEPVRLLDGRKVRVWAVRGPERFAAMGEPQIAQAYKSAAANSVNPNSSVIGFP